MMALMTNGVFASWIISQLLALRQGESYWLYVSKMEYVCLTGFCCVGLDSIAKTIDGTELPLTESRKYSEKRIDRAVDLLP